VLPGRPRVQAAQGRAGRLGESRTPPSFQELHESLAPEGTARDEMLRQYPFGILLPRLLRRSTNDRSHTENTAHAVASDRTAHRVGMKLEFVAIPAKRAAETDYGYLDEGDEVLKCFDLSRYATLFGFVAWAFENLARHADAHALSCHAIVYGRRWGKLPWRKMLRYSGKLGKKAEKVTGGEHALSILTGEPYLRTIRQLGQRYPHAGYGPSFRRWLSSQTTKPYGSMVPQCG